MCVQVAITKATPTHKQNIQEEERLSEVKRIYRGKVRWMLRTYGVYLTRGKEWAWWETREGSRRGCHWLHRTPAQHTHGRRKHISKEKMTFRSWSWQDRNMLHVMTKGERGKIYAIKRKKMRSFRVISQISLIRRRVKALFSPRSAPGSFPPQAQRANVCASLAALLKQLCWLPMR